jgi:hypothetical protein
MVYKSIRLDMKFLNVLADISADSGGKIKHIIFVFNVCRSCDVDSMFKFKISWDFLIALL